MRNLFPDAFDETLHGSPLALVASQIRFADPRERLSTTRVSELMEALPSVGHGYARAEPTRVQTVTIEAGGSVAANSEISMAWRLISDDGRWVATIASDNYTLETTNYRTWQGDFRARIEALIRAIDSVVGPAVVTRVGLRYVDSFRLGNESSSYRSVIVESLLGPILHPAFGNSVTATQQQFSFALDDSVRATIRHGLFPNSSREDLSAYLLDTDIYREDLMRLDSDAVLHLIDDMHEDHLRVFRACLTDAGLAALRHVAP